MTHATLALAALALASVLGSVPAQAKPRSILGIVTDPAGKPVSRARAWFVRDPVPDVPSLRDLAAPSEPIEAMTDSTGIVRIPSEAPGLLLITTDTGLGAIELRCWPDRAVRLHLEPMAEVTAREGSEFELFLAARLPFGNTTERRLLPTMRGKALRVPAGEYEAWWRSAHGAAWQSLELRSGHAVALSLPEDGAPLPDGDDPVWPEGFAHFNLRHGAPKLLGKAAEAKLVSLAVAREAPLQLTRAIDGAPDQALCVLLAAQADGSFRVSAARNIAAGHASLPSPETAGNDWVLLHAPSTAALVMPLSDFRNATSIPWPQGRMVACSVIGPDGSPLSAAPIVFRPALDGPETARCFTDELGRAQLGPITGAGFVCVEGPSHLPFFAALSKEDAAPIEARLEAGEQLKGRATFADTAKPRGIVVTLRDPTGRARPAVKSAICDAEGAFSFSGLDAGIPWIVFASATHRGTTWSARATLEPGASEVTLTLQDEDPRLRPADR